MRLAKLKFIGRCVISLTLIAFIIRKISWSEFVAVITRVQLPWVCLGSAGTLLLIIGLAVRWRVFLRIQRFNLSFPTILSVTWAGQFFNAILPGSTGGDIVKIYQVCRLNPEQKASAAATVIIDRLTGLFALACLAAVGIWLNPLPLRLLSGQRLFSIQTIWLLLAGSAFLIILAWLLVRRARAATWSGRVLRTLAAARTSLVFDDRWFVAFSVSLAMHLLTILTAYLFSRALGLSITYLQMLEMIPVISIFIMLPITINGHGLRELLLIAYFTQFGATIPGSVAPIEREIAIAFSLLMVTNDLVWAIPGGIVYFFRFKSAPSRELDKGVPRPETKTT